METRIGAFDPEEVARASEFIIGVDWLASRLTTPQIGLLLFATMACATNGNITTVVTTISFLTLWRQCKYYMNLLCHVCLSSLLFRPSIVSTST